MKKLTRMISVFMLPMTVTLQTFAANPCEPIATACKQAGYVRGDYKAGNGLIENCVIPIVNKEKTKVNVTFTDTVLEDCKATIKTKIGSH